MKEENVTVHISARKSPGLQLSELWEYRELLFFLVWRDIKVRYKQTVLGVGWAVIQPFMTMVVFSIFFGHLGKIPSDGVPYPVFSFAALVPWAFFSNGLTQAGNSIVNSSNLITKVYFPRLVIPIAAVFSGLMDFVLAFLTLLGMMVFFGIFPSLAVFSIIFFLFLALVSALGTGLWLSSLNVKFRDVRYVIPFSVQIWMYATPIAYPSSFIPEPWRTFYGLNPMSGVIEGFRSALFGTPLPAGTVLMSVFSAIALLVSGLIYFRRTERNFADVI